MTRLILLDRDGVINVDSPDHIKDVDEWVPLPGSIDAIVELKRKGYLVAVCTNQSGIGRGIVSPAGLARIHTRLESLLGERGARLDGLRFCPHRPDCGCRCRKPEPGMLIDTLSDLGVDAADALFVGDSLRDVKAAIAAGCRPVLVRSGNGAAAEAEARALGVDWVADDLAAVAAALPEVGGC